MGEQILPLFVKGNYKSSPFRKGGLRGILKVKAKPGAVNGQATGLPCAGSL